MEATINEKAMKAIGTYLERRGFEILESGWAHGTDGVTRRMAMLWSSGSGKAPFHAVRAKENARLVCRAFRGFDISLAAVGLEAQCVA